MGVPIGVTMGVPWEHRWEFRWKFRWFPSDTAGRCNSQALPRGCVPYAYLMQSLESDANLMRI